jgi:hypothetical protein
LCVYPQEALGFSATSSILVITPIPDITNKESHTTQIDWSRMTRYKRDSPVKMVTSRDPNRSWPKEVNKAWP